MVRYNRRYKRYRKRYNRKLTKTNIYLNKSARSQATQIAALNRKINYISRRDKPETKVYNAPQPISGSFTSDSITNTYTIQLMQPPARGVEDNNIVGDKINLLSVSLNLYAEYYNTSNTGYHNTESSGGIVRIIALQVKNNIGSSPALPSINNILQYASTTGSTYTAMSASPFINGITKTYRILFDAKYPINTNRNQLCKNIILRPKYKSIRLPPTSSSDPGLIAFQNSIFFVIIGGGLHADTDFTEYINYNLTYKYAYTDS